MLLCCPVFYATLLAIRAPGTRPTRSSPFRVQTIRRRCSCAESPSASSALAAPRCSPPHPESDTRCLARHNTLLGSSSGIVVTRSLQLSRLVYRGSSTTQRWTTCTRRPSSLPTTTRRRTQNTCCTSSACAFDENDHGHHSSSSFMSSLLPARGMPQLYALVGTVQVLIGRYAAVHLCMGPSVCRRTLSVRV